MAELALRDRLRSRSRGRSDVTAYERPDRYERQLWEKEAEIKRMREKEKRETEAKEAKEEEKRIVMEYEEKKRREAEHKKAEEARIKEKIEREKRETEEKEKREWAEFLLKQKEKAAKEKAAKEAEEEKLQHEMRRRLEQFGWTQAQIDIMVDEEKTKKYKAEHGAKGGPSASGGAALEKWENKNPTYVKVHRDYLAVETLHYYDIPFKIDQVSSFILIAPARPDHLY